MRQSRAIVLAIILSLIAHLTFVAVSRFIWLHGIKDGFGKGRSTFRIKGVDDKAVNVSFSQGGKSKTTSAKSPQDVPKSDKDTMDRVKVNEKMTKEILAERKQERSLDDELNIPDVEDAVKTTQPVLEAEAREARKTVAHKPKTLTDRFTAGKFFSKDTGEKKGEEQFAENITRQSFSDPMGDVGAEPAEGMGSFQPSGGDLGAMQGNSRFGRYEDISEYLNVGVRTYTDPVTKENYFEIGISVKENSQIEILSKEVIFLVDSSKSITAEKLEYIKKGVIEALDRLDQYDRFNVVAFRGELVKFKTGSVEAAPKTVSEAKLFVKGLEATGQTDVNNALMGIVEEPIGQNPSYVMLISDGRPTAGVIDSRLIIQEITRENKMARPVFCYGGGFRVNRYLLDFISYQNRAWCGFSDTANMITRDFVRFFEGISDPILINVRYRLNSLSDEDVYPKHIPDFYMGKSFVVYGRYTDEDVFSMQLLGEMGGKLKEFIFQESLKSARQGGAEIAKEWAFRKIYYLISQDTMGKGDTVELKNEITELSKRFGIITPYDIEEIDRTDG